MDLFLTVCLPMLSRGPLYCLKFTLKAPVVHAIYAHVQCATSSEVNCGDMGVQGEVYYLRFV